jgi:hypothetical protein
MASGQTGAGSSRFTPVPQGTSPDWLTRAHLIHLGQELDPITAPHMGRIYDCCLDL